MGPFGTSRPLGARRRSDAPNQGWEGEVAHVRSTHTRKTPRQAARSSPPARCAPGAGRRGPPGGDPRGPGGLSHSGRPRPPYRHRACSGSGPGRLANRLHPEERPLQRAHAGPGRGGLADRRLALELQGARSCQSQALRDRHRGQDRVDGHGRDHPLQRRGPALL